MSAFGFADQPFTFAGLRVIENRLLTVAKQFRFPRSKRRRIRNKWKNNRANWSASPDPNVYRIDGAIIGHPATVFGLLRKAREVTA